MEQFYNLSPEEAAAQLGTDLNEGLSADEARERLARDGYN